MLQRCCSQASGTAALVSVPCDVLHCVTRQEVEFFPQTQRGKHFITEKQQAGPATVSSGGCLSPGNSCPCSYYNIRKYFLSPHLSLLLPASPQGTQELFIPLLSQSLFIKLPPACQP